MFLVHLYYSVEHRDTDVHFSLPNTNYKDLFSLTTKYTTSVGTRGPGGPGPPTRKKGASTLFGPPTFHGSPLSALPSVCQFISCHTLGSTALVSLCVRGHFRALENEKFSTPCQGVPLPQSPQLGRSAPSCVTPHF